MMAQRYFDLRDPVNQAATIGLYGQVSPPATPHLNHVSADGTYIAWMAKKNLASMRDQGNSCLNIYFIFLLIYSWYSGPLWTPALTSEGLLATGAAAATTAVGGLGVGAAGSAGSCGGGIGAFWNGAGMYTAAQSWASAHGGRILSGALSGAAAQAASGDLARTVTSAQVFINLNDATSVYGPTSTWWTVEYPILVERGIPIVYNLLGPNGWSVFGH